MEAEGQQYEPLKEAKLFVLCQPPTTGATSHVMMSKMSGLAYEQWLAFQYIWVQNILLQEKDKPG